jgi:biopolymer transport protein TolR
MAGGIAPRGKRRVAAEINVVPYIDVMLVLLVIFMVTAPLLTQGVDVELPETSANTISSEEEPVTLYVDGRGRYFLDVGTDKDSPVSDEDVVARIGAVLRNKPKTMVLVKADQAVPYNRVANGMSLLQQAGATKLGFVTDSPSGTAGKNSRK